MIEGIQMLCLIMAVLSGVYLCYWLVFELPALIRNKHNELWESYKNRWREE